jgi:hypothetical protein
VSQDASDAQFDQLVRVFSGQLGGPMAGLAPLIGELLGAPAYVGAHPPVAAERRVEPSVDQVAGDRRPDGRAVRRGTGHHDASI